jgi:DNA-binding NarL/FixJ family response regulator
MQRKIRVFHVDDHKIMRDGVYFLLSQDHEIEMVGNASSADEFLKQVNQLSIDVLVLDLHLNGVDVTAGNSGRELCKTVHGLYPTIKLIAHTANDNPGIVDQFLKAGGSGFVSKRTGFHELIHAIKVVHQGKHYICAATAQTLKNLDAFLLGLEPNLRAKKERFSPREREIMELLAQGRSSKEIAELLVIADRTVETHRKNLMEKAGVKNTAQLIAYGAQHGLLNHG